MLINFPVKQASLPMQEAYCAHPDADLVEQMPMQAALQEEDERRLEIVGVSDDMILSAVENLAFDYTTVVLLEIVPMLDVAWSDGVVSRAEHDLIVAAARDFGVTSDSAADRLLTAWLKQPPSDEVFMGTLEILKQVLKFRPPRQRKIRKDLLLKRCTQVASASGGCLGLTKRISAIEHARLHEIAFAFQE
jgi:hypothetical protein